MATLKCFSKVSIKQPLEIGMHEGVGWLEGFLRNCELFNLFISFVEIWLSDSADSEV